MQSGPVERPPEIYDLTRRRETITDRMHFAFFSQLLYSRVALALSRCQFLMRNLHFLSIVSRPESFDKRMFLPQNVREYQQAGDPIVVIPPLPVRALIPRRTFAELCRSMKIDRLVLRSWCVHVLLNTTFAVSLVEKQSVLRKRNRTEKRKSDENRAGRNVFLF